MKALIINLEPTNALVNFLDMHFPNRYVCNCGHISEILSDHGCGYEYIGRRCESMAVHVDNEMEINHIINASIRGEYNVIVIKKGDTIGEILEKQLAIPVLIWE